MEKDSKSIKPIKNVPLVEQVEDHIMQYLKANKFKTGDALPKEIELAQNLGVSRNVAREALSRLRMLGIIESKKRKGMVISEPDLLSGVERVLDPDFLGEGTMQNIFELRLVLEVGMSDILFIRKKSKDIDILQDIVTRESQDPECTDDIKVRLAYEIEFHSHLYRMSRNNTLQRFQSMLLPVFHYMMEQEARLELKPKKGSISHQDLVDTIKNGTPRDFRENMREHLTPHYQKLIRQKS
ncbi:DNA-binding transcriptional regulator, FadR family [Sinomicrobium oceani]|uniref:DNA-binding transcriptional regulator, FadR family n=1 Tax=Sinomicrobium oceani TaxID=1150368 RepID=A0A1K1QLW2_9FLAO|nr:GntR family transcriptional regulator [Sinomicrobium oceani]SFW60633.1 DNA-binding transcriptional regulator, FadR family [Sinomicrobium oceani]